MTEWILLVALLTAGALAYELFHPNGTRKLLEDYDD
jgi:hypothetical protein